MIHGILIKGVWQNEYDWQKTNFSETSKIILENIKGNRCDAVVDGHCGFVINLPANATFLPLITTKSCRGVVKRA